MGEGEIIFLKLFFSDISITESDDLEKKIRRIKGGAYGPQTQRKPYGRKPPPQSRQGSGGG